MGTTKDQLRKKKALTDEHFVPADDAQAAKLQQAQQLLALARFSGDAEKTTEAEVALEAVKAECRAEGISFVLVGVGRKRFEEMIREHPPTDEQKKENQATFNPETFYPAIFAETIEGDLDAAAWKEEFFDSPDWGPGEIAELRGKVMAVNTGNRVAELGN